MERDDTTVGHAAEAGCRCGRIRLGHEITENRNLNLDCPVHGIGTDYWSSPAMTAQIERAAEWQRRAARARHIAANPDAASASEKLRTIADRIDLDDERSGRSGTEAQDLLRRLADRLEKSREREQVRSHLVRDLIKQLRSEKARRRRLEAGVREIVDTPAEDPWLVKLSLLDLLDEEGRR